MLTTEEKEIFNAIARYIVLSELDDKWQSASLKLMVIGNTVEFNLTFLYENGATKNTKLENAFKCSFEVLKLYKLTNEHPNYKKWNRSEFILFSDSKCKIEYVWEEDLQNKVDE
ncbi:hypothetical protein [Alistipes sp. ZOR0009]|uniref:hypothetical protein n=1 Tax=Alistipes sp. ZOR0009 TaxID=1339253 RepID=UPI0006465633|nr:hypothetical protein [Alistipes sp. ZOR0009]